MSFSLIAAGNRTWNQYNTNGSRTDTWPAGSNLAVVGLINSRWDSADTLELWSCTLFNATDTLTIYNGTWHVPVLSTSGYEFDAVNNWHQQIVMHHFVLDVQQNPALLPFVGTSCTIQSSWNQVPRGIITSTSWFNANISTAGYQIYRGGYTIDNTGLGSGTIASRDNTPAFFRHISAFLSVPYADVDNMVHGTTVLLLNGAFTPPTYLYNNGASTLRSQSFRNYWQNTPVGTSTIANLQVADKPAHYHQASILEYSAPATLATTTTVAPATTAALVRSTTLAATTAATPTTTADLLRSTTLAATSSVGVSTTTDLLRVVIIDADTIADMAAGLDADGQQSLVAIVNLAMPAVVDMIRFVDLDANTTLDTSTTTDQYTTLLAVFSTELQPTSSLVYDSKFIFNPHTAYTIESRHITSKRLVVSNETVFMLSGYIYDKTQPDRCMLVDTTDGIYITSINDTATMTWVGTLDNKPVLRSGVDLQHTPTNTMWFYFGNVVNMPPGIYRSTMYLRSGGKTYVLNRFVTHVLKD